MILTGVINGIIVGGIVSLTVLGIAVIYGITGIVNFAVGTIGVFSAFLTWYLMSYNILLALLAGIATGFVIGYALQRFLLTPLSERGAGLTLFFIITNCIGLIFTGLTRVLFPRPNIALHLPRMGEVSIGGVTAAGVKFFALFLALGMLVFLRWLEEYTNLGKAWKATSENLKLAKVVGINTNQAFNMASGIGCALAALGAILWGSLYNLNLGSGWSLTFTGYIIAVVGGIGNIWGGMLAALLMGMVLSFSAFFVGGSWQSVILYGIVIFALILAPRGILGSERAV